MVRNIIFVFLSALCLCGCSGSDDEPSEYVVCSDSYICPFASSVENFRALDTLFVGTSYKLNLFPFSNQYTNGTLDYTGEVSNVVYMLDGEPVVSSSKFPFSAVFTPEEARGKCTLSVNLGAAVIRDSVLTSQIVVIARVP